MKESRGITETVRAIRFLPPPMRKTLAHYALNINDQLFPDYLQYNYRMNIEIRGQIDDLLLQTSLHDFINSFTNYVRLNEDYFYKNG